MSSSKRRRWTTSYWSAHRARGGSAAPRAAGAVGTGPAETATAPSTAAAAASPTTDAGSPEPIWRWAAGWLAVAVGLPTMFWLHFGVIDGAAWGDRWEAVLTCAGAHVRRHRYSPAISVAELLGPDEPAPLVAQGP